MNPLRSALGKCLSASVLKLIMTLDSDGKHDRRVQDDKDAGRDDAVLTLVSHIHYTLELINDCIFKSPTSSKKKPDSGSGSGSMYFDLHKGWEKHLRASIKMGLFQVLARCAALHSDSHEARSRKILLLAANIVGILPGIAATIKDDAHLEMLTLVTGEIHRSHVIDHLVRINCSTPHLYPHPPETKPLLISGQMLTRIIVEGFLKSLTIILLRTNLHEGSEYVVVCCMARALLERASPLYVILSSSVSGHWASMLLLPQLVMTFYLNLDKLPSKDAGLQFWISAMVHLERILDSKQVTEEVVRHSANIRRFLHACRDCLKSKNRLHDSNKRSRCHSCSDELGYHGQVQDVQEGSKQGWTGQ
jgi:hypothetical protein